MEAQSRLVRFLQSPLGALLFFAVASVVVYSPVLHGEKLWDDHYLVSENPLFKSPVFALEAFRHWLFFDSPSIYYRPAQNLTYILDYLVWGGNVFGYHLTNMLLHGFSGAALFFLLRRLLAELSVPTEKVVPTAFAVALVWTVHPIHNAAVAYISGRADSQASLFAITAWLLACRVRGQAFSWKSAALTGLAMLCGLLAVASKELGLIWALLFIGYTVFVDPVPGARRKVKVIGAVALVFVAYLGLHALPEARVPIAGMPNLPFLDRALLMLRALGDYAWMLFYPDRLMMDRTLTNPAMHTSVKNWFALLRVEYLSIIGVLTLIAFLVFSLRRHPGRAVCACGAIWFCVAFLPISNLFPLNAEVAEHWIYHASMGFLVFVAGLCLNAPVRWVAPVLAVAVVALGWRTARRAADWAEPERFYLANIAVGAGTPRIHHNLASVYLARGDYARQEKVLRALLAHFPDYATAQINLGICLSKQGRKEEAAKLLDFGKTASDDMAKRFPRTWQAALQLSSLRAQEGKMDEALTTITEAGQRFPGTWDLVKYEAQLRAKANGPAAALPPISDFAATHWWHQDAQLTLGQLRLEAGDPDGAVAAMKAAAWLDIHDARPFANIARIELTRGQLEAAAAAQQRAIKRDPDQPSRYLVLADILTKLGRTAEAAEAIHEADELRASVTDAGA